MQRFYMPTETETYSPYFSHELFTSSPMVFGILVNVSRQTMYGSILVLNADSYQKPTH